MFVTLGERLRRVRRTLAVTALVGAIAGLVLGRLIDAGHGRKAVLYAIGALVIIILLRAAAPGHVGLAVIANALGALVVCLYVPTMMTAVYTQAKRSACALRFHVATEGGWDAGGAAGCLIAALLAAAGIPLSVAIFCRFSELSGRSSSSAAITRPIELSGRLASIRWRRTPSSI